MLTTKEKIMAIFEEHIDKETLRSILATKEKINELPVNSLQFIKIIVELEEALSIEIDNDRLSMDTFCSFEDFFLYIENLMLEKINENLECMEKI